VIDRAQALWASQLANKRLLERLGKTSKSGSAGIINSLLRFQNSPVYGILGTDVIYFQRQVKEEYIPYILAHEELHLLVYEFSFESTKNPKRAIKASHFVDNVSLRKALSEVFETLDYETMMKDLATDLLKTMPIVGTLKRLVKKLFKR